MIRPGAVAGNAPPDHYVPSWWDYLFAGKPAASKALNPVKAAVGVFTPEVDAIENAIQPLTPEAQLPQGWYDARAQYQQERQELEGTGSRAVDILIPVTSLGQVDGFFPADVDFNSVRISAHYVDDSGNLTASSLTARIAIKVNTQDARWTTLSFNVDPSGQSANDDTSYTGAIRRIWIQVVAISEDTERFPFIVLTFLKNAALGQGGSVPGGTSSPSQSYAQASSTAAQENSGVAGAPLPSSSPAPSGQPQLAPNYPIGSGTGTRRL